MLRKQPASESGAAPCCSPRLRRQSNRPARHLRARRLGVSAVRRPGPPVRSVAAPTICVGRPHRPDFPWRSACRVEPPASPHGLQLRQARSGRRLMPRRRCLDWGAPGCLGWSTASRCRPCATRRKAARNFDTTVAAVALSTWRSTHGDWCPGWKRPGHPATDLTAEHGPHRVGSGRVASVLCRSCNAAKRDRG